MYISYVFNWLYNIMQVPFPLVASDSVFGLVTVFDLFLFSVYCGIFIVLIRYMVTDNLSLKVGDITDFSYSSSAYLPTRIRQIKRKTDSSIEKSDSSKNVKIHSNNSIAGRILNRKVIKSMNKERK